MGWVGVCVCALCVCVCVCVCMCVCLVCVCACSYIKPNLLGPRVHSLAMDQEVTGSIPTVTIFVTEFGLFLISVHV